MSPYDCGHEVEVIDAIASCRWPDKADPALRAHVAACEICADVAAVASACHAAQEAATAEAPPLPSAQIVWFRAQARARAELARQAGRPIVIMQALGFAGAAAVISALIGVVAFWVWTRADLLVALPAPTTAGVEAMGFAIRGTLLAIGLWLILAPFAVYLAASDD